MYDDFPVQSFVKWPDENKRQQHQKINDQSTHQYNVEEHQMTDPPRLHFSKQPHSNWIFWKGTNPLWIKLYNL